MKSFYWVLLAIVKGSQHNNICCIWILYAKVSRFQSFIGRWSKTNTKIWWWGGELSFFMVVTNFLLKKIGVLQYNLIEACNQIYYFIFIFMVTYMMKYLTQNMVYLIVHRSIICIKGAVLIKLHFLRLM